MSDHERGAYTPEAEEPLSFDARRPSERRPFPMTLIGSVIVLLALVGGVALVYRGGVRGAGEAPRPVGEPVMSVKTAAAPGGETREPASSPDLYAAPKAATSSAAGATATTTIETTTRQASSQTTTGAPPANAVAQGASAPTFAAAPEQPAPRPAPQLRSLAAVGGGAAKMERTQRTVTTTRSTVVGPSPVTGAPDDTEVAAAGVTGRSPYGPERSGPFRLADATPSSRSRRPAGAVSEGAETDEDEAALGRLASRSLATAAPAAPRAVKPGGAVVQIGAFSSSALADKGYADVASDMAGHMSGKAKHVLPLDVNGHTLYRTWLSGFASRADAIAFCEALRAQNKACIVKS